MALLRCFYSLRITAGEQRSGCVSFRFCEAMASKIIPMEVKKKVEDFRKRWVYMDVRQASPLFEVPTAPAVKHAHWEGIKITDDSIGPLVRRLEALREAGLTGAMVAKEFVRRRIAPLQRHKK